MNARLTPVNATMNARDKVCCQCMGDVDSGLSCSKAPNFLIFGHLMIVFFLSFRPFDPTIIIIIKKRR